MLYLAIVDKLNRAGFVVAPYNTPEEESSVKSVPGPARHVGEAGNRVRSWRGWVQCAVKNSMAKIKKCPRGYWRCSCWRPGGWYWCRAGSGDRRCGWGRGWRCGCHTAGKATGMKKRKYGQITKNGHFGRFFHILTVFSVK